MFAIEAVGLRKTFINRQKRARTRTLAVAGVDIRVPEGQICGLLGPNGAGKTTTLMMLLGVTEPDEGSVRILGHQLPQERSRALEGVNFTASYVGMPNRVRVGEIMDVFATLYGASRARVDELLDLFGLRPFEGRYVSQLSSGQRTLVGLAKSLLNHPRLLVLDEPTASLDPDVAERVRSILRDAHASEGFTLLITSHNMADIERLCDRVVFVASGRVVADGTTAEIAATYGAEDLEGTFLSVAARHRAEGVSP